MPKQQRPFSALEVRYLRRYYAVADTAALAARLHRTTTSLHAYAHKRRLRKAPGFVAAGSHAARFRPGHVSWNTGRPGNYGGVHTRFQPGTVPPQTNRLGDGAVSVRDRRRSPRLYVRLALGNWQLLHVLAWEQAYGSLPASHVLRCRSADTLDPAPANWELVSRTENARRNGLGQSDTPTVRLTDAAVAGQLSRGNKLLRQLLLVNPQLLEIKRQQLLLERALHHAS